jgi:hypothetical protein
MASKKAGTGVISATQLKAREERLKRAGFGKKLDSRLPIEAWQEGLEVEGVVVLIKKLPDRGAEKGGHLFHIDTENGRECYGAPASLLSTLEQLTLPVTLNIFCLGKGEAQKGKSAPWLFDVRMMEAE